MALGSWGYQNLLGYLQSQHYFETVLGWCLPFLQIHSVSQTPEHVISQQIGVEVNVSIQLAFIKPDIKEISKKT